MVHTDGHDLATLGQMAAIIGGGAARTIPIAATVDPDHHRLLLGTDRAPHVQDKAVLTAAIFFPGLPGILDLVGLVAQLGGIANALPWSDWHRRAEAIDSRGRFAVADTLENVQLLGGDPAQLPF